MKIITTQILLFFLTTSCATISFMKKEDLVKVRARMPAPTGDLIAGVWNIGHRGSSESYPENTIPSFDQALKDGANMIEFDVIFTHDLVPVVIHDETLDRTTNGKGLVHKTSYSVIKNLDAGSWKDKRFAGTRVPTLDEVLSRYKGKIAMNVELKKECLLAPSLNAKEVASRILYLAKKHDVEDQILISSFEHSLVDAVRAQNKLVAVAYLTHGEMTMAPDTFVKRGIDAWNSNWDELTDDAIADFHSRGRLVYAWGTNDAKDLRRLVQMGISGAFVDNPKQFAQILLKTR